MRALLFSIVSAFLLSSPAIAATSGAYAASEALSADACARRCADDGLCVMWVYRASTMCELRASLTDNLEALAAGVSPRAPAFARATDIAVIMPAPRVAAVAPTPSPPPRRPHHAVALLGAPDTDRTGLRARIGD